MEKHHSLLEELNESQRRAVEYCDGPQLVIAGAGSGKTRVLTYKIAYLMDHHGLKPWNILALTFTNKAAREMRERIGKLVGEEQARRLYMGTFHSIFSRILRREAEHIGFNGNFTIYDESDSRSLIKTIIKELNLNDKVYKPTTVHNRISMAKNHLILATDYAQDRAVLQRDYEQRMPAISEIYTVYTARCRQANALDFDDLLAYTYVLFNEHEDIRQKYAAQFAYVLVDEYQDTNSAQQRIVWQLTKERQSVCVVGDDAQSIYGFRGANIDNILEFTKIYDNALQFKLERNYRSTQRIVQAANSLIKHNQRQIPKDIYSRNDEGERLILKKAYSDKEEALIVGKDIKRIRKAENCEYSDFAILYRTNAQSRSFEEAFRKENIPYRIYGGLSFYQRKEIKDIIAYFRLVANPDDEEAIKRIINYPARGIGDTTVAKVAEAAMRNGVSLWCVVGNPVHYGLNVNKGTATRLLQRGPYEMKKDFFQVERGKQVYVIPAGREINRVMYVTPSTTKAALYGNLGTLDTGIGGGFGQYGNMGNGMGITGFYVGSAYDTALMSADLKYKNSLLRGDLAYQVTAGPEGTHLVHLLSVPGSPNMVGGIAADDTWGWNKYASCYVWYTYYDVSNASEDDIEQCRLDNKDDIILTPDEVPLDKMRYELMNNPSQQITRRLLVAEAKILLGIIRGTYSGALKIPEAEMQMDYNMLLEQGKSEKETVLNELKERLERMTPWNLMEKQSTMNDQLIKVLKNKPLGFYVR